MKCENIDKLCDKDNDKLDDKLDKVDSVKEEEKHKLKDKTDDEKEDENQHDNNEVAENSVEEKNENPNLEENKEKNDAVNETDVVNNVSIEKSENEIDECLKNNTEFEADTTTAVENIISPKVIDSDISEKPQNSKEEYVETKFEDDKVNVVEGTNNNDVLNQSKVSETEVVDLCNDTPPKKLLEPENESSNSNVENTSDLEKSQKPTVENVILQQPKVQTCNSIVSTNLKENENVPNNYDKIIPIQNETKPYTDQIVLPNKFKEDTVETEIRMFNDTSACNDFPKPDITAQPVSSVNEKQYSSPMIVNPYCKSASDSSLLSNTKQYGSGSLPNEFCKTDTTVLPKQYNETLMNDYRKLDVLQPEMNKQLYNKDVLPVTTNSSQEVFKVIEQSKPKVSEKVYSHSIVADNTITVPKYDNVKHEKQSKRTTPSPKTMPYRLPAEVPQVEKQRLHDYLPPMGFINYQKINNSIAMAHSDLTKTTKDMYVDKKTDSVNMNLPKEKDVMNLPKNIDNSLLYSSVMPQSPYTDQSMMHLSLHHHLAHSSQYHHSPPVPAQVPTPVHQTKSRNKKSEQRRLAQQNQTPIAPSTQQSTPPSLPSHTQSYHHHHHQTATYMMPQPSPSSPYHHSVIQHRMSQQSGSCSSADFYLSHSNQHAAAAAAQIASCNLSKLQQMTNGLDHHRRHIASPASSPASSPANMTPPPAASAAAAHLLQQSAVAYHKLYQQAGQTNQSRQYGHQSRGSPASPNVGLMSMQYGAPPPPFNGYRVAPQSTPPPSAAASYMNQTTGQLQYTTHSQDPHHQNSVYPSPAYNGSYLQPLNGSMHR